MRELPGAYGVPEVLVSRVGEWEYLVTQMNKHTSRAAKPQLGGNPPAGEARGGGWRALGHGRDTASI